MAKQSRLKQDYRANASKLHRAVGDMLRESPILSGYRIYQEYPVNMISPYYDSGREKFDWIIMDLMVVIECHGQQHYQPVRFGGITEEEAQANYAQQIIRDMLKKEAAIRAGWTYVVFKYDEKDTSIKALMNKIDQAEQKQDFSNIESVTCHDTIQKVKEKRVPKKNTELHKKNLEKARKWRKKWYKIKKRWKNESNRSKK